jgi:hypothetical protein
MDFEIDLPSFLSRNDELRFFQGLKDLAAIREFRVSGERLLLRTEIRFLTRTVAREFIALLTRYQVSLGPLQCLSVTNKKFAWLADPEEYWHQSMFGDRAVPVERKIANG